MGYVEIRRDAFAESFEKAKKSKKELYSGIRRPLRGIEIKEDTYAVIKVLRSNGSVIPLTDAGGQKGKTENYSNFIIQSIDESRQEKAQIIETFGDSYVFFFGERPRLLNVSGLLMNTADFNWRSEFWYNYERVLRGTRLVEQNARIYLFYDDIIVEGYMLSASAKDDAEMPYHIPFNFTLFLTCHSFLSTIGDENYPITHAVKIDPVDLRSVDVQGTLSKLKSNQQSVAKYVSSIDAVRQASIQAELARIMEDQAYSGLKKAIGYKNMLMKAMIYGLNAQNMTFLSIVNHFFRNRKMRFPKGLAGAEAYTGMPTYANDPGMWAEPQRTLPYRSKISDNIDEYINGGNSKAIFDEDAIIGAEAEKKLFTPEAVEARALADLAEMGLDPVQHPGGSPLKRGFSIGVIPTEIPDVLIRGFGGSST